MTGGGKIFLADVAGPLLGWSNPAFSCGLVPAGIGDYAPIQIATGESPPQFVDLSQNPDEARSMHDLLFPEIRGDRAATRLFGASPSPPSFCPVAPPFNFRCRF